MNLCYDLPPVEFENQMSRHWFRKYRKASSTVWVLAAAQAVTLVALIAALVVK